MGRFDKYDIDLRGFKNSALDLNFHLDNEFFAAIDGEEFQRGAVDVEVTVKKNRDIFDFAFAFKGTVIVPCDRCLDDLEVEVEAENNLKVKLGESFADEGDVVVVPESDGDINIAWFLYEFIALALPLKRVHAPGKCNREMAGHIKQHTPGEDTQDDGEREIDPRWESLKNLQIEEDI